MLLLATMFGLDLVTFNLVPTVWCDDVSFTEPAINLLKHGTFTTTVWQFQPPNTFPAVNCPLYPLLLVPWLACFGTSLLAVRAMNFLLMGVASYLFWQLLCRLRLVTGTAWRLAFTAVFHLGYGISFAYRCSRPDTLGLVLTLCLVLVLVAERFRGRQVLLLSLAMLLPWTGLNGGLYAGLVVFIGTILLGRPRWWEAMTIWAGLILGVASVASFLWANGVLTHFITGASHVMGKHYAGASNPVARVFHVLLATLPQYVSEYSTALLLGGAGTLLVLWGRRLVASGHGRPALACALLIFTTPMLFNFVGHYAFYYSYTIYTPALLLLALTFGAVRVTTGTPGAVPWPSLVVGLILLAAGLAGLPLRMAVTAYFATVTPRAEIQQCVDTEVTANDKVFSDDCTFFEVKRRAGVVYTRWSSVDFIRTRVPGRSLTPAEKESVTKLVVRADRAEFFTNYFGGRWEAAGPPFGDVTRWDRVEKLPVLRAKVAAYLDQPQTWRYPLQILRRASADPPLLLPVARP